ncbi:DUF1631 domain-containing protein [Acidovorax sp. NCPPB 3859]|nr:MULTISPECIES: DUF1631 family protein [unclassified Acidovorax]MDA8449020.1 DUF1631 domain-containing protein [Acidovorax sp. GBBC 3297]MDA8458892.1 DUF1631 domain-containing protein [Acidovorax sp. GBBC 3333]MDA8463776.1 DUF1631 domain-containing protein [Acidovorax sp. GBBC 3332]MDA8468808.1 DUF1631 domain-containing protein [Acidovorax sp. GBBC 3299]WCM80420.1 DUF1631 domain-containing protein [Acidovorax sp. GBBC 712]
MSAIAPTARSAFRACVVAAIRDGEAMMEALVAQTRDALEAEAPLAREPRRRDALEGAGALLAQHAPALVRGFPMALLEIFAGAEPDARARPSEPAGLDFGELSLMDEAEVMAQVELSRAQQVALHATEAVLAELDALVSAAQGLPSVRPDRNPLRPENYIRALQQVVGITGVSSDVRTLWMAPLRNALGTQLQGAYRSAAARLREDGVQPVGYAVAGHVAGRGAAAGRWQGPASAQVDGGQGGAWGTGYGPVPALGDVHPAQGGWRGPVTDWSGMAGAPLQPSRPAVLAPEAEEALLTVAMLRQMLAQPMGALATPVAAGVPAHLALAAHPGGLDGLPVAGLPLAAPPDGVLAAAAAEAMEDIAELERIVGRLSGSLPAPLAAMGPATAHPGRAAVPIAPPAAGPAAAPARSRSRAASEVVSRMMDNIAQDDRLLAPVQRSLQNLRPALQRLVRHDPRFFTDERHPARRLLDALTQRALSFDSEDAHDFSGFARLMERAVESVTSGDTRSADTFAAALAGLEVGWSEQDRRRREREESARAVAQELKRREELSRRVSQDIRALARTEDVPPDIVEFAAGPWADVVARAQADRPGEDDPGGYLAVVPELFWLAQPDLAARTPERLAPVVTRILGALRGGLDSVGHDEGMTAAILERVATLHQAAAEQAAARAGEAEDSGMPQTGHSLLEPEESEDSERPGEAGEDRAVEAATPTDRANGSGDELSIGTWVELTTNHRAVHTQLTWASPHHTLFLFTAPDGSTQSMTRRVRDKLMAEGALRVLPGPPGKIRPARGGSRKPVR